jgi:hypothetical protein
MSIETAVLDGYHDHAEGSYLDDVTCVTFVDGGDRFHIIVVDAYRLPPDGTTFPSFADAVHKAGGTVYIPMEPEP